MKLYYVLYLLITAIGNVPLVIAAFYGWVSRKRTRGSIFFAFMMVGAIGAEVAFLGIGLSQSYEAAYFWGRLRFIGVAMVPIGLAYFSFAYTGRHLTLTRVVLLVVVPAVAMLLLWTNEQHGMFYKTWTIAIQDGMVFENIEYNWAYRIYIIYMFGLLAVSLGILIIAAWRSQGIHRYQYLLVIIAAVIVLLFNLPSTLKLIPFTYPSLNQLSVFAVGITFAVSLFRFKLLDIRPIAYESIVDSIEDGVLVLDTNGRVVSLNPAGEKLTGSKAAKVRGKSIAEIFPAHPDLSQWLKEASPRAYELTLTQDNVTLTYELRTSPVHLKTGEPVGRVVLFRDVTASKRTQAQTMELTLTREKMKIVGEFIASSSHDLRTPLSIINTSVYLLRKITDPTAQAKRLDLIDQQSHRLARMIEQLHELVRLNEGLNLEMTPIYLNAMQDYVPQRYTDLARKKDIAVDWQLYQGLPSIRGDLSLVAMAFENILHNALVYTPEHGKISVRSYLQDNASVIEVEDTGVGIAPEHHAHIFDEFYKVDTARGTNDSGAGVGLTMVKKIMEMHGGQVTFSSTPGVGSTFRLAFPLRRERQPQSNYAPAQP